LLSINPTTGLQGGVSASDGRLSSPYCAIYAQGNDNSYYIEADTAKIILDRQTGSGTDTIFDATNEKVQFKVPIVKRSRTIADNDATPDMSSAQIWTYNGTSNSVTVTDFDNPVVGIIYTIIGNSDTYTITINDAGNFNLSANWTGGVDDVITIYVQSDNDYIEISRTDN
jgi:hypothetical protein